MNEFIRGGAGDAVVGQLVSETGLKQTALRVDKGVVDIDKAADLVDKLLHRLVPGVLRDEGDGAVAEAGAIGGELREEGGLHGVIGEGLRGCQQGRHGTEAVGELTGEGGITLHDVNEIALDVVGDLGREGVAALDPLHLQR